MKAINVVVIEDNADYRLSIEWALADVTDIHLLDHFGSVETALRKPDWPEFCNVILLDIRLPGMSGLDAIADLQSLSPEAQIIILSQSDKEQDILDAIAKGARGYLLKSAKSSQIVESIRSVHQGDRFLDVQCTTIVLDSLQSNLKSLPENNKPGTKLTQREMEILKLLSQGLVKRHIAEQLGISYSTVDTHVAHIFTKFKVKNAASAVNEGHLRGIL